MKFFTDEMCGDITRWLRILGYNTCSPKDYQNKTDGTIPDDDKIIEICLSTFRILITKDYEITKKMKMQFDKTLENKRNFLVNYSIDINSLEHPWYPCLLLRSNNLNDNLTEIHKNFNIELDYGMEAARCPKCNSILQEVPKLNIDETQIPPNVYKYHSIFWVCSRPECGQYFWKGTHFERIQTQLKTIKERSLT